ncbi:hypothetical protein AVEN_262426-1 [Araneus ventricosus]|uniref:Uncharacterized protein n=1 Tax=Araneus ventricosus TaxID=182803 RepID=A0A4Y2VRA2_ARAVE|nr:hypothetical protein AVEN_262426-1 [Araneus ventricosus]
MDIFVFMAVFLQLLFCTVQVTVFGEYIFILPILGYAILGELLKYTLRLMMAAGEEKSPGSDEDSCPMKQSAVLVVQSRLLGQALDWKAEFAVEDSLTKPQAAPTVRNPLVWSFCKRLKLEARLVFPPHAVLLNAEDVPTVQKRDVYVLCQALGLQAQLAS